MLCGKPNLASFLQDFLSNAVDSGIKSGNRA
jgi:hypothetical protein